MGQHMAFEVTLLRTTIRALTATVRFFSGVSINVLPHSVFLRCSVWTVGTREGFFSSMGEDMSLEILFSGGTIGTVWAGKGLLSSMSMHVSQKVSIVCSGVATVVTVVRLHSG